MKKLLLNFQYKRNVFEALFFCLFYSITGILLVYLQRELQGNVDIKTIDQTSMYIWFLYPLILFGVLFHHKKFMLTLKAYKGSRFNAKTSLIDSSENILIYGTLFVVSVPSLIALFYYGEIFHYWNVITGFYILYAIAFERAKRKSSFRIYYLTQSYFYPIGALFLYLQFQFLTLDALFGGIFGVFFVSLFTMIGKLEKPVKKPLVENDYNSYHRKNKKDLT